MWITGVTLIYIRTAFDLNSFSPKLWLKVVIMALLIWNAHKVVATIIPMLRSNVGSPLIDLPIRQLMKATQLAINSMFCWTSGLLLGSSVVLKNASWEVLLPLALGWLVTLTLAGQLGVLSVRMKQRATLKTERASIG